VRQSAGDDREHLAPPLLPGCEPDLAARRVGGLEHLDVVAAFGGDACGVEPRGAGADDGRAPERVDGRDRVTLDRPAVLQLAGDRHPLVRRHAAWQVLVPSVAQAHDEVRSATLAERAQHVEGEAHAVVELAVVRPLLIVGQRRPQLFQQVAAVLRPDAARSSGLSAFRRVGESRDDARHVPVLDALGKDAATASRSWLGATTEPLVVAPQASADVRARTG
jgi:hypothetical protein